MRGKFIFHSFKSEDLNKLYKLYKCWWYQELILRQNNYERKIHISFLQKWRLKSMSYINVDDIKKLFYAKLWEENSYFILAKVKT